MTGRKEHAVELFAAWMASMRDLRQGQGACEIFNRFMDNYNSRLADFLEIQDVLKDVVDVGATDLTKTKLWRVFVWLWLGCGGQYMQPWRACRNWPQVKTYKENDVQQPLAILKYVHVQAEQGNSVTAVIGADGLDKKTRLFRERDLVDWHASVPELVAAWKRSPKEFLKELKKLPSFQTGKLTRKELWCVFAASSFPASYELPLI